MLRSSRISLALSISLICLSGCTNRAPSLRMLDERAGYESGPEEDEVGLYQGHQHSDETLVRQMAHKAVRMWIFPHELPSKDWFLGGFVRLDVTQEQWIYDSIDSEDEESGAAVRETKKPTRKVKKGNNTNANS